MKSFSTITLATAMLADGVEMFGGSKATGRTLSRKLERVRTGTRKMYEGITAKTSQKLKDTKDKLDRPTGVMVVNTRKTQRNEPCPCGSEKKFKHCHLS